MERERVMGLGKRTGAELSEKILPRLFADRERSLLMEEPESRFSVGRVEWAMSLRLEELVLGRVKRIPIYNISSASTQSRSSWPLR